MARCSLSARQSRARLGHLFGSVYLLVAVRLAGARARAPPQPPTCCLRGRANSRARARDNNQTRRLSARAYLPRAAATCERRAARARTSAPSDGPQALKRPSVSLAPRRTRRQRRRRRPVASRHVSRRAPAREPTRQVDADARKVLPRPAATCGALFAHWDRLLARRDTASERGSLVLESSARPAPTNGRLVWPATVRAHTQIARRAEPSRLAWAAARAYRMPHAL